MASSGSWQHFIWTVSKKLDIEDLCPNSHVFKNSPYYPLALEAESHHMGLGAEMGAGTSSQQGRCQQLLWRQTWRVLQTIVCCWRDSGPDSLTWHKAEKSLLLLLLNRRKVVTHRQPEGERHEHTMKYRTVANRALNKGVKLGYEIGLRATETSQTTSRGGK